MRKMILLHGALGSELQLEPLKNVLKQSFEVFSFSFEGHGEKATNRPLEIANFSENLLEFVAENHLEKSSIFGYSMGGYVALYTEALRPGTFAQITTLGTKFLWNPDSSAREVRMLQPEIIEEKVPKFAAHLARMHAPNDWKENMRATAEMMERMGEHPPLDAVDLSQIQLPVQLLLGTKDAMVSVEETLRIQEQLPHAKFDLLENVEHPIEKLDLNLLLPFLKGSH